MAAHLREQKNPFLFCRAIPFLKSEITLTHFGTAENSEYRKEAEDSASSAYRWEGEIDRKQLLEKLQTADFFLNTSHTEGSSNAIYEACMLGVPVIASAIPGNVGVLGEDYPGLFSTDDPEDLARVLNRFSDDANFREDIRDRCEKIGSEVDPERERRDWLKLIDEIN